MYYVQPQSGSTLFVDRLRQAAAGCKLQLSAVGKICGQTDREIARDRSTEDNGCPAVLAKSVVWFNTHSTHYGSFLR